MVRAKGLEPPHLSILVPKTSASTNSATPANRKSEAAPTGPRRAYRRVPLVGCGEKGKRGDA